MADFDKYVGYRRELFDLGWIHEVLMERFDNAFTLMTPNSVVYGGAVRDCVAGIRLQGDLDIAVSSIEFGTLIQNFLINPKWVKNLGGPTLETKANKKKGPWPITKLKQPLESLDGPSLAEPDSPANLSFSSSDLSFSSSDGRLVFSLESSGSSEGPALAVPNDIVQTAPSDAPSTAEADIQAKSPYNLDSMSAPMDHMTSFLNVDGREAQLIRSKYRYGSSLEDALEVARKVDMVCCGLALLPTGEVFEVVPDAYQDCLDRVLRFNESSDTVFIDSLPERVDKLIKRGWKNTIDIAKVMAKYRRKTKHKKPRSRKSANAVKINLMRVPKRTITITFPRHLPLYTRVAVREAVLEILGTLLANPLEVFTMNTTDSRILIRPASPDVDMATIVCTENHLKFYKGKIEEAIP